MNADRVFHALGDPTRRALVERLCERRLDRGGDLLTEED